MRNKKSINFLLTAFLSFLIFTNTILPALTQTSNESNFLQKEFGWSLRKSDNTNRTKAVNKKQNNFSPATGDDVIRIETTLIVNDILVFDKQGNSIEGLKKEDFIVKEDGKVQQIESFSAGDSEIFPRSIVLIIDYSVSQLPYIETSIEAAKLLVEKLNPNDRMAIVTDNVEMIQNFTHDRNLLKAKLDEIKNIARSGKFGKSKQYCALMAVLQEMFNDEPLRPIIIFQTDGDELALLKKELTTYNSANAELLNFGFRDILAATEIKRANIYTIIPGIRFVGIPEDEKFDRAKADWLAGEKAFAEVRNVLFRPELMRLTDKLLNQRIDERRRQQTAVSEIANFTGGWASYLEKPEQAETIYNEILSGMNRRYVIGYYPTDQTRNGKRREVKTEVRGKPEYVIIGRKSYILGDFENKN